MPPWLSLKYPLQESSRMNTKRLGIHLTLRYSKSTEARFTHDQLKEILTNVVDAIDFWRDEHGIMPKSTDATTTDIQAESSNIFVEMETE
jgi:hypothetical protein